MIFFIQLTDAMHYGEKQRCQRGEEGWMEGLALSLSRLKLIRFPVAMRCDD